MSESAANRMLMSRKYGGPDPFFGNYEDDEDYLRAVNGVPFKDCDEPLGDILRWLDAPSFQGAYEALLKERFDGTGAWFYESDEFRQFVEGHNVTLWGTGPLGAGKSVMMAGALKKMKEAFDGRSDVAVLYALIREDDATDARTILLAFLRQLLESRPDQATPDIHATYLRQIKEVENEREPGAKLSETEVVTLLIRVLATGSFSKVYFLTDGLDEVAIESRERLLRAITTTVHDVEVNLFITSTPLDELRELYTPNALHVPIEVKIEDVEIFVCARSKRSSRLTFITENNDPKHIDRVVNTFYQNCRGLFIMIRLQMDALRPCNNRNSLFKVLATMWTDYQGLYDRAIYSINRQSKEDADAAHRAFLWLGQAQRPLTTSELRYALASSFIELAFDTGELIPEILLFGMLGGLVIVEPSNRFPGQNECRLLHKTAAEYFKTASFKELPPGKTFVGVCSVVYLTDHWEALKSKETPEELAAYVKKYPLLPYLIEHWTTHARLSQDEGPLHPFIVDFLTKYDKPNPRSAFFDCRLTGLHLAARYGLVDVITAKALPAVPIPGDEATNGWTPFHHAADTNQVKAMEALLNNYYGVNVQSSKGDTPLHIAVRGNQVDIVKTLLGLARLSPSERESRQAQGLDDAVRVDIPNNAGDTALDVARQILGTDEIQALLTSASQ